MSKPEREKPKHETVMDVTAEQIARVYAQAFLGVLTKSANGAALIEELESVVTDVLDKFPALGEMLRSAFVSYEEKQRVFDKVLGGRASPELLNFLKVLAARERLGLLRTIARHVKKLYDEERGVAAVEIHVAYELSNTLRQQIQDQLRTKFGKEPALKVFVDSELIGGMKLRVGDQVYDGTVSTQLKLARKSMIEKTIELIETRPEKFMSVN